jgi:hypothetical protein
LSNQSVWSYVAKTMKSKQFHKDCWNTYHALQAPAVSIFYYIIICKRRTDLIYRYNREQKKSHSFTNEVWNKQLVDWERERMKEAGLYVKRGWKEFIGEDMLNRESIVWREFEVIDYEEEVFM